MSNRGTPSIYSHAAKFGAVILLFTATGFGQSKTPSLTGSWAVTVRTTASSGVQTSTTTLVTFMSGGTAIESPLLFLPFSAFGPLLETPGHGVWQQTGNFDFDARFVALIQAAPNNPAFNGGEIGTDLVHLRVRLASSGNLLSGTFERTMRDTSGNVFFSAVGTFDGAPI